MKRQYNKNNVTKFNKARSVWYSGGGGAWNFFEKNFLALILAEKIILLNGTVKKIICLQ